MQKLLSLVLAVICLMFITACGNTSDNHTPEEDPPQITSTPEAETTTESNSSATSDPEKESSVSAGAEASVNGGAENSVTSITITVGDSVFEVELYDNASARAIAREMPFTLNMSDYASQEKVADLTFDLPSAFTETPATINAGELYLWSGNSLVLFYTTFSNSYSYVPVGYITDTTGLRDALGNGSVEVTFANNN